jgi:hypothetical protein
MSAKLLTPWIMTYAVGEDFEAPARVLFDNRERWIVALGFRYVSINNGIHWWSFCGDVNGDASFCNPANSIQDAKDAADKRLLELGYQLLSEDDMEKIELLL